MGSSTKKHKKERERDSSRKHKHRSRSRSRSPLQDPRESREIERRHKKHHRDRKREKVVKYQDPESDDSDVIEVPPAPQISRGDAPTPSPPPPPIRIRSPEESQKTPTNSESLSVEETNKLRAKLGLKPLDGPDNNKGQQNDGKYKDDLGEFYHAPAKNITRQKRDQKVRDRIAEHRDKRAVQQKLADVRGLAESDTDDDTVSWIKKSRQLEKQKEEAAKREKILEELDAEFGIGELVAEDTVDERRKAYNARQLKGLRVEHDVEQFKEGRDVILTLKDQEVLDEGPDALVNVNMIDDERYKKSNENKKQKPHYHGYDVFDETAETENRSLLKKYDEVIDGDSKTAFTIGEDFEKRRTMAEIKAKLNAKRLESLYLAPLKVASDFLTPEEIAFKKPKKKVRKLRQKPKMLKADDLEPLDDVKEGDSKWLKEIGSRRRRKRENPDILDTDDTPEVDPELTNFKFEPEVDQEIEAALRKVRRIRNQIIEPVEQFTPVKLESKEEVPIEGSIVLNSTAEFCRSLGEIPTYGLAGNRDEESDLMDFEVSAPSPPLPDDGVESAWNSVPEHVKLQTASVGVGAPILEDEPSIGSGVGGALKLAMSKGYLEREDQNRPSSSRFAHLQAQNYSIEDKSYGGEDDKFGGRRERYAGPTTDFKEKDGFKPNVKLDYIDDDGHVLSAKEAFRYLSHKFHGKGPGKNKVEKRLKKNEQEGLMKKMSSTDTPLGTLGMLQAKQKETNSAFVVLSGSKQSQATSISKNKR